MYVLCTHISLNLLLFSFISNNCVLIIRMIGVNLQDNLHAQSMELILSDNNGILFHANIVYFEYWIKVCLLKIANCFTLEIEWPLTSRNYPAHLPSCKVNRLPSFSITCQSTF